MVCQSVRDCVSPFFNLKISVVASATFATGVPSSSCLYSGSLPQLPISVTLLRPLINGDILRIRILINGFAVSDLQQAGLAVAASHLVIRRQDRFF
jgi:hypothetical protein